MSKDGKFFTSSKKGDIYELKQQLNSTKKSEKQDGVKKVIASMTVGKDVSQLFSDVIQCMQTDNLELKKLVYLYLMHYAKAQPTQAIMAVNTFVKDCVDPNPLIRALAVRTMGCIRVDKITEYLCDPLRKTLKDDNPYVRKTAAVCVAKLYDIDPTLVEEQGFIDALQELLSDPNPMVVANAVAALSEIQDYSSAGNVFDLSPSTVSKLLTALNECTEWGQVFILDSLSVYEPADERERQNICERVTPRLQHVNAAVVLSAVKVLMRHVYLLDADTRGALLRKLAPPLVTLLSGEPEVQYVALRNINLIVQKDRDVLINHLKVFFVKYNDPVYVKMDKLDVMIRLANEDNIREVLAELKEYATEIDVDFVRKSVRAIGRCAIKISSAARRCVDVLLDLIETKVNYVVQEAIVVIKDVFRKYPNTYENIIGTLCENLESLEEPSAKAAMIWIVGEYADRIDNADELLESFLDGFVDENTQVQLQLLTAIVKLFLKRPGNTQELVMKVLGLATQESDNPDLRDRGYIYWRLLLTDPAAAKRVVLCEKPLISEETDLLEPTLLDELLCHISSLASVYHKPPSTFIEGHVPGRRIDIKPIVDVDEADLLGDLASGGAAAAPPAAAAAGGSVDLLGGDLAGLGLGGGGASSGGWSAPKTVWLSADAGKGLEICGTFGTRGGQIFMDLTFTNKSASAMADFAIQFNKNSFGLAPAAALQVPTLAPNAAHETSLLLSNQGAVARMDPLGKLQVAVKNAADVLYFSCVAPFTALCAADGALEKSDYLSQWKAIEAEATSTVSGVTASPDAIIAALGSTNVFLVARRPIDAQERCYFACKLCNGVVILIELTLQAGTPTVQIAIKTTITDVVVEMQAALEALIKGC